MNPYGDERGIDQRQTISVRLAEQLAESQAKREKGDRLRVRENGF